MVSDLVELFNRAGHCLSYEQVLQVDTSLAESTLKSMDQATGAIIPPNLVANKFIHFTADNIDVLDETLDGKNTFHATQMATWQRGQTADAELFKCWSQPLGIRWLCQMYCRTCIRSM